jgi:hypothetical protein
VQAPRFISRKRNLWVSSSIGLNHIWIQYLTVQPAGIKSATPTVHSTEKEFIMRRVHRFTIRKETHSDMIYAGRYNRCLEITYRDRSGRHTHKLSAGYSDDIDVYRDGSDTYVLSSNPTLGYIGLEVFDGPDKTGEIFVQQEQVKEVLGRDDLAPFNAIKRLREYIP